MPTTRPFYKNRWPASTVPHCSPAAPRHQWAQTWRHPPLMKGLCLTLELYKILTQLFNGHCCSATISNTGSNSTRGQELSHNCVSQGSIKCLLYYPHDWVKQFSCRHMTTGLPLNNDFCLCPLSREMFGSPVPNQSVFVTKLKLSCLNMFYTLLHDYHNRSSARRWLLYICQGHILSTVERQGEHISWEPCQWITGMEKRSSGSWS